MSHSYKSIIGIVDRNPYCKNQANQKVRRYKKYLPNGKTYKKLYQSYNISDFINYI